MPLCDVVPVAAIMPAFPADTYRCYKGTHTVVLDGACALGRLTYRIAILLSS